MALNEFGGFAAGLSQGINQGVALHNQASLMNLRERDLARMERRDAREEEQFNSEKELRDRRNNALRQIADYTAQAFGGQQQGQQQPGGQQVPNIQNPDTPSFGPTQQQDSMAAVQNPMGLGGQQPSAPFAANNPAALTPQPTQQAQPADVPPGKILERGMVTGMYSPKMLTDIAGIFAANGLTDEGIKYMEQAYSAEKRGGVRASMALMQNNPGAAAKALQAGGVELEGMPEKVSDDPNDMRWKLNIKGQGEKAVDVRDWLKSTMDPEAFFQAEDRRMSEERKAATDDRKLSLDERVADRKLANDERKTDAEIGFLSSRSQLAKANANKADRYEPGSLRPTRSTESQINTALSRRDKAFDRVSMVRDEFENKLEVDPMKRQVLDSAANSYQAFLEDLRGEELDSREHHKFTDAMVSYPVGGTDAEVEEWENKTFLPRFKIRRQQQEKQAGLAQGQAAAAEPARTRQASPAERQKPGGLQALQERERARLAVVKEMEGVQQALKTPNLSTEQKKTLALKAQELAKRRDSFR